MLSDTMMRNYLGRLLPLQENAGAVRDSINEIKREARSDGLNLDAINALVPLLHKYPHDKGASVLKEVIQYAEMFGTESLVSQANSSSHSQRELMSNTDVSGVTSGEVLPLSAVKHEWMLSGLFRLSTQVVVATSVSIGLIWLLS